MMKQFFLLLTTLFVLASFTEAAATAAAAVPMEGDWQWEMTSYWHRKKEEMGHTLKKCVFLNHVAQTGEHCPGVAKHDYSCMFGTAWECAEGENVVDSEPAWICLCNEETWMFECAANERTSTCVTDGGR